MRQLKYHEKKLLKKVDFISWKVDDNLRDVKTMKKYYVQKREDFIKYKKLARHIHNVVKKIKELDEKDPYKIEATKYLLDKLYDMGLIPTKTSLEAAFKVNASSFCRRRLPVFMKRIQMAEQLKAAVTFVEHGHVRVGPELVNDPAFLVTRTMADFVTWTDTSAIKKHVLNYSEMRDDFDIGS